MGTPVAGPDPQPVAGKALPEFQMRTVSEWAPGAMEVVTLGTKTMQDINIHTFRVTVHHENNLPLLERRKYGVLIDGLGSALAFVEKIKRDGDSENGGGSQVSTVEVQLLANAGQADLPLTEAVYSFYVIVEFDCGGISPKLVKKDLLSSINQTKTMFLEFLSTNEKKYTTEMEKRPQSAYMLFTGDERGDLVANGMSLKEAMVELGKKWCKLSAAKKKMYEDKAAALKAKYTKQEEKDENKPSAKYDKQVEDYKKTATHKKYQAEREEFYAHKKADLKKLEAVKEEVYAQKEADLKKLEAEKEEVYAQKEADLKKLGAEMEEFYAQKKAGLKKLEAEKEEFYAQKDAARKKLERKPAPSKIRFRSASKSASKSAKRARM